MSTGRETPRIAVVPVRGAVLPAGADETIAEAGGVVLLAGSGTGEAAVSLAVDTVSVATAEIGDPAFGAWAVALAPVLAAYHAVLLPASADGGDLAPRLAAASAVPEPASRAVPPASAMVSSAPAGSMAARTGTTAIVLIVPPRLAVPR